MRLRQQANCLAVTIPTVYPVLQPVSINLTTEEYLAMTDEQFNAYLDAQYGDDEL